MTENKKKGFSALDVLVVLGAVLVVLGMIGQNVAVYLLDRAHSKEELELSYLVRTYESSDAQTLSKALEGAGEDGLACLYGDKAVCYMKSLHIEEQQENAESKQGASRMCSVTGVLLAKGYLENENTCVFGYGEVAQGDVLVLSVSGRTLSLEITKVNVKKNENNT